MLEDLIQLIYHIIISDKMKQVIIVRKDLEMGKGKIAAQVAHASLGSARRTSEDVIKKWENEGFKKIVLKIDNEKELIELSNISKNKKIPHYLVRDAGKTQIKSGTITALGIGPEDDFKIDHITSHLKLL